MSSARLHERTRLNFQPKIPGLKYWNNLRLFHFKCYTEADKEPVTPKYHEDIKNNGSQTARSTVTPRGDVRTSYLAKRGVGGRRASVPTTTTTSTAMKKPKSVTSPLKSPGRKSVAVKSKDEKDHDSCDEGMCFRRKKSRFIYMTLESKKKH